MGSGPHVVQESLASRPGTGTDVLSLYIVIEMHTRHRGGEVDFSAETLFLSSSSGPDTALGRGQRPYSLALSLLQGLRALFLESHASFQSWLFDSHTAGSRASCLVSLHLGFRPRRRGPTPTAQGCWEGQCGRSLAKSGARGFSGKVVPCPLPSAVRV